MGKTGRGPGNLMMEGAMICIRIQKKIENSERRESDNVAQPGRGVAPEGEG